MTQIIASVSGVRGIYGDNLTTENINKFASAFSYYCSQVSKSRKIVVGRDGRLFGDIVSDAVISNLVLSGFEVIDIGIAPTPTVQIATEKLKAAGGIAVTASHNPQNWNGLKFLNPDGTFLDPAQIKKFLAFAQKPPYPVAPVEKLKRVIRDNTWCKKHIDLVLNLKSVNIGGIRKRKFKVVADVVNSSGSVIVPMLLKKLGCTVVELFCDGSGVFPHTPEPLPKNLTLLTKAVKKYKADMGLAVDPDGDRLVIITDTGEPFGEENTITTVINNVLRNSKLKSNSVTVNLSTTRAVDDVANAYKAKVFRSPVGEINVVKEMKRNKSVAGGEGSGGVIIPDLHYGRDAMIGIAIVLQELAEFGGKVSDYKKYLPQYFISKDKVTVKGNPDEILKKVKTLYGKSDCHITSTDGMKLDFEDYWVHLRKSNTEPIIRIIAEARTKKEAEKIQNRFMSDIKKLMK